MRARTIVAAAVLAAVLVIGAVTVADAKRKSPARLFVDAREWSVTLSRASLPAGRVRLQMHNAGEDDHDLRLRRLSRRGKVTGPTLKVPVTTPGDMAEQTITLRRGRWKVWCSLPGHARSGMRATLRAR